MVLELLNKLFDRFVDCLVGFIEVDRLSVVTSPDHLVSMAISDVPSEPHSRKTVVDVTNVILFLDPMKEVTFSSHAATETSPH